MQAKTTKRNDTPDTSDPRSEFFLFPCWKSRTEKWKVNRDRERKNCNVLVSLPTETHKKLDNEGMI